MVAQADVLKDQEVLTHGNEIKESSQETISKTAKYSYHSCLNILTN